MSAPDSVTNWLAQLQTGDPAVAQALWERYFPRMVALARKRLAGARRREADEEDVALCAFDSFCRGAREGRFPNLADRDDLWRLLIVITARKAIDLIAHQKSLKQGGGRLRGESAFLDPADPEQVGIEQVVGDAPTPAFAHRVAEECQRLLQKLGDEGLRAMAVWKMEGYTNEQIAEKLGVARATVERRLRVIRKLWEGELSPEDPLILAPRERHRQGTGAGLP
jgi:DNA-directed RNA polymerase specialized sigma24 family protein